VAGVALSVVACYTGYNGGSASTTRVAGVFNPPGFALPTTPAQGKLIMVDFQAVRTIVSYGLDSKHLYCRLHAVIQHCSVPESLPIFSSTLVLVPKYTNCSTHYCDSHMVLFYVVGLAHTQEELKDELRLYRMQLRIVGNYESRRCCAACAHIRS
jgi:hypothetical protein